MTSKVAVVTGGNKGIGFAVVKQLCENFDGTVYLTSRNETLGQKAVEEINKGLPLIGVKASYAQLDIDNQESVDKFHNFIKNKHGGLDVLVNNAAIAYKRSSTESFGEQASVTVRVNYFGTLRVCESLFPLLRPGARVANMSSFMGLLSRVPGAELREKLSSDSLTVEELNSLATDFVNGAAAGTHEGAGWANSAYSTSKVLLSALTRVQQIMFNKDSRSDLVINHCSPGFVDTDMTKGMGGQLTPEQGAVSAVYSALLPPNTEIRGQFVDKDTTIKDWTTETFVFKKP